MPALELTLRQNESVISVSGELSWMTTGITMSTTTQAGGGVGGFFGALARVAGGGSLFMTEYQAQADNEMVAFAAKLPGQIIPLSLKGGVGYCIHRHGFMCATPGVQLATSFQQSLGAGVFGGDGFLLQALSGQGEAWVQVGGEIVIYDLQPGQQLQVHPGHVGIFESSVSFEITRIRGIRNLLFGGDGMFLALLTGPGRVWLQTLSVSNLAQSLIPYLPSKS